MGKRRAFVTGATGLLGGNLCRHLVTNGWQVTGLVRSREKAQRIHGDTDIAFVEGKVEDVSSYASELDGVNALFHTAAFFREYFQPGDHWETMKRINVDATLELFREAASRGVPRAVFTSSSGVIENSGGVFADESAAYSSFAEKNLYFKTKVLAEQELYRFLESSRMDVMFVLPGWMMGPGDAGPTSAGQLVLDLMAGRLPGLIDGGSALADARDVAAAMANAAEKGRRGERYIVAGPLVTMEDIAHGLQAVSGAEPPKMRMPAWLALTLARISETWASVSGGVNRLPINGVKTLLEKATMNSEKAKRELGVTFRPLEETLADTVAWYREHGYLEAQDAVTPAFQARRR